MDWTYNIGGYTIFTAPNEFVVRVIVGNCPYSKDEICEMQLSNDETLIYLIKEMLKDLSIEEAQEVLEIPTQVGLTLPYYATLYYYRCSSFLLETFPKLEFNCCSYFNQTPYIMYKPLMKKILQRGLNPFITPHTLPSFGNFFNWYFTEYAFDAHEDLKDCKIQKDIFFTSSPYIKNKEEIEQLGLYDELVEKYVTGFAARVPNHFTLTLK